MDKNWTPDPWPQDCEASDVTTRLCRLQEWLDDYGPVGVISTIGNSHAHDCFCGKGCMWPKDKKYKNHPYLGGYRNDGLAVQYTERATLACAKADISNPEEIPELVKHYKQMIKVLDSEEMKEAWMNIYTHGVKYSGQAIDMVRARNTLSACGIEVDK